MKIYYLLLSVLLLSACSPNNDGWNDLFNGKDLSGWQQLNGKAKYEVVDGMIVGTTVANTPNSFLCTEKLYSDFILELDLWVDNDMNSGIQFRSESNPEYNKGRVHGYQCEVDPSDRAWSAGIYDEARRGWLYPVDLNPDAKIALKKNEWNRYRIECIGNSIKTWLNGIPVAHIIDNMTSEGFIALQVHSVGNNKEREGQQIKWKNIRIKTENLSPSEDEGIYIVNLIPNNLSKHEQKQGIEWIFDGVSIENFNKREQYSDGKTMIKNNILAFSGANKDGLETKKIYDKFDLSFDFMFSKEAFCSIKYKEINDNEIALKYGIADDNSIYNQSNCLASLCNLLTANKEKRYVKGVGKWNRGRIVYSKEGKVQHWLNGRKVLEYDINSNNFKEVIKENFSKKDEDNLQIVNKPIVFKCEKGETFFRSIKIKEL